MNPYPKSLTFEYILHSIPNKHMATF